TLSGDTSHRTIGVARRAVGVLECLLAPRKVSLPHVLALSPPRTYDRRASGHNRDYRIAGRLALAGRASGPRSGAALAMRRQPAANGHRHASVARRPACLSIWL